VRLAQALCLIAVLLGCIPQQEAIVRLEQISDGKASLKQVEGLFQKLDYQVEAVYSSQERQMSQLALEKNGDLAMGFRSNAYSQVQIVARYRAAQNVLEIKLVESPVSTSDWRFTPQAVEHYNKLIEALKSEFGADKIIIERTIK
jgi:hypothetical protein